jgi:heptosyltransferase-1
LNRAALSDHSSDRYAVLLHATARREKEWPIEHWIALGHALHARNMRVVLPFGNAREAERSGLIAAALPEAVVPDLQPLDSVARLVAGASLVVGVDTGLLHLASALAVPLVAIFVGSEPALTAPVGRGPIAVIGGKGEIPAATDVMAAAERL